jgi:ATP-dependent Clp protease protease subunit
VTSTSDVPMLPYAQSGMPNPTSEIYNRLLKDRIVILGTDVNDDIANIVCAQMLYLEGEDDSKDIWLYVNSPGG